MEIKVEKVEAKRECIEIIIKSIYMIFILISIIEYIRKPIDFVLSVFFVIFSYMFINLFRGKNQ